MKYYSLVRDMSKYNLRYNLIVKATKTNISETASYYNTTRKTVRKWLRRFEQKGLEGLKDISRAPKNIPHKMPEASEWEIVALRKDHPG